MALINLHEDIETVLAKDPAARSPLEVVLCYPGMHALWTHRLAHRLWQKKFYLTARLISHACRYFTGVEIHPGADIGRRVFIDHGMGVVIGETAEIGDDVLIYMGVVLGGTALQKVKRHPTIGNGVIIGSGASILGPIHIGNGAKVGAGSVVVRSVPPDATVVGVPGRIAGPDCGPKTDLGHGDMPDPMLRVVSRLLDRQNRLEAALRELAENLPTRGGGRIRASVVFEREIREALKRVIDPEVGIDIVDLGLVKEIRVENNHATVDLVLTTKGCPLVDYLSDQVKRNVREIEGIDEVTVNILDEPWNWDRFVSQKGDLKEL
jgi:serine O-acetyltransferase